MEGGRVGVEAGGNVGEGDWEDVSTRVAENISEGDQHNLPGTR
jgi:hypothetical protein